MSAKKKILVVEDEKPILKALTLKLLHAGFEVETAENGEDGMRIVTRGGIDLILLDLVMPKMDGFSMLEALRAASIKIPIIVLSNLSQSDDEKRAKSLGAHDFFVKSDVPIADLVDRVRKFLGI